MKAVWISLLILLIPALTWADEEADRIQAIKIGRRSVVSLRVYRNNSNRPGVGSGIILRSDGFILTNSHVVEGAKVVRVGLPGGKQYNGRIWKEAPDKDLALVKIEATGLQVQYPAMIQTDAAINPGSSGGALINLSGEVLGVNTLIYNGPNGTRPSQGLGFAIPITHAVSVAKTLVAQRPVSSGKPWLGLIGDNLSPELSVAHNIPAKRGVMVRSMVPGSPADQAGMRVGDTIVQCDAKSVLSVTDFLSQIAAHKPGDTVELGIWRRGKKTSVKVTLDVAGQ